MTTKTKAVLLLPMIASIAFFPGCTGRPPAVPAEAGVALPWGAVDVEHWRRPAAALDRDAQDRPLYSVLALSGEGSHVAFSAGYLAGWTATGRRPRPQVVTAVSTAGLLGTFAFLGPAYDEHARRLVLDGTTRSVYRRIGLVDSYTQGAANALEPLRMRIAEEIDETVLDAVAREHRAGRRFFIGTTNLDRNRVLIWDMGAIASSDREDRLQRYHDVLIATMSQPIQFPPVYFEVEFEGETYAHMVVDGAVKAPILVTGFMLNLSEAMSETGLMRSDLRVETFVIVGGVLGQDPRHELPVAQNVRDIALTSIGSLFTSTRDGALYRAYALAHRNRMGFNLAALSTPSEDTVHPEIFDVDRMQRLFDRGRAMAESDEPWWHHPPGLGPRERFERMEGVTAEAATE